MLQIREEQMLAFEQAALRRFEDEMVAHLAQFAPRHCEVIGEPALRQAIRLGMERARKYGLTNRGPVRFYLELMFMFGGDFDTDPQLLWAIAVLNDPTIRDQMVRADRLYEKAMECVDIIAGPNYDYAKEALRRASKVTFDALPPPSAGFEDAIFAQLREIHSQKVEYLGEARTRAIIAYGKTLPEKLALAPERGAALCVGAMFALGHGFGNDPLLPWISRTITNRAIADPFIRTKRVYSRMMTYLDRVLANQDSGKKS